MELGAWPLGCTARGGQRDGQAGSACGWLLPFPQQSHPYSKQDIPGFLITRCHKAQLKLKAHKRKVWHRQMSISNIKKLHRFQNQHGATKPGSNGKFTGTFSFQFYSSAFVKTQLKSELANMPVSCKAESHHYRKNESIFTHICYGRGFRDYLGSFSHKDHTLVSPGQIPM